MDDCVTPWREPIGDPGQREKAEVEQVVNTLTSARSWEQVFSGDTYQQLFAEMCSEDEPEEEGSPEEPRTWLTLTPETVASVQAGSGALFVIHEQRYIGRIPTSGEGINLQFIDPGDVYTVDAIFVGESHLYWTAHTFPRLKTVIGRALLNGTSVEPEWVTVATEKAIAYELLELSGKLYFAWEDKSGGEGEWIGRMNLNGSGHEFTWFAFDPNLSMDDTITTDGTYLYFGLENELTKKQSIGRVKPDGTSLNLTWYTPAEHSVQHLVYFHNHIYWRSTGTSIGRIATDGSGADLTWLTVTPAPSLAFLGTYYYLCYEYELLRGKHE